MVHPSEPNHNPVRVYLQALQMRIVQALEQLDGGVFLRDAWTKAVDEPLQGNGLSCVLENGKVFERAGVLFSHVQGQSLPATATQRKPHLTGRAFEAIGVSLVLHPRNPYVPTVHMNVRGLIAKAHQPDETDEWWFGGGMDLTPYYPFDEDAVHFHRTNCDALAPFGTQLYLRFKQWCDEYFYLKHRGEARGIGGIFFDDFSEVDFDHSFGLMQAVGNAFLPAYLPIAQARMNLPYAERERTHQLVRRGRYVEFNLVFDRGTLFGLQSGGRTESILVSMPPVVQWQYNAQPAPGSAEDKIVQLVKHPRDWLAT